MKWPALCRPFFCSRANRYTASVSEALDLWRLAAGLGLFLFGMHQLEGALTRLAGRSFKKFLRQHSGCTLAHRR